jgi:hypothetical protein
MQRDVYSSLYVLLRAVLTDRTDSERNINEDPRTRSCVHTVTYSSCSSIPHRVFLSFTLTASLSIQSSQNVKLCSMFRVNFCLENYFKFHPPFTFFSQTTSYISKTTSQKNVYFKNKTQFMHDVGVYKQFTCQYVTVLHSRENYCRTKSPLYMDIQKLTLGFGSLD